MTGLLIFAYWLIPKDHRTFANPLGRNFSRASRATRVRNHVRLFWCPAANCAAAKWTNHVGPRWESEAVLGFPWLVGVSHVTDRGKVSLAVRRPSGEAHEISSLPFLPLQQCWCGFLTETRRIFRGTRPPWLENTFLLDSSDYYLSQVSTGVEGKGWRVGVAPPAADWQLAGNENRALECVAVYGGADAGRYHVLCVSQI